MEEYPPFRGSHQDPWNIREIEANGGLDAKRAVFPGQQHPRRADSRQQAARGCKKDVAPVPNGVRKGAGYELPTLCLIELEIGLGLLNRVKQGQRVDFGFPCRCPPCECPLEHC